MSRAAPAKLQEVRENAPPRAAGFGFAAIVGQPATLKALQQALSSDRLPHALLFAGPPGVGKATIAGVLSQALNCPVAGPTDACGTCVSCSKISRGLHPDVLWVRPEPRQIKIGRIRKVNAAVGYAPHEARRRVVVIDEAHTMNDSAQNAFLKTLEEPPASSTLILVTSAPGSLLPTVRSRCQSLRLGPVPLPAVREHLERALAMDPTEARLRASLTPGSLGGALALDLDAYAKLLEQVVHALRLAQSGGAGVVTAAEALAGLGHGDTATQKAISTLEVARDVFRDLLVVASGADESTLVNAAQTDTWQAWARELTPDATAAALASLNEGIDRLGGRPQPSVRLSLEHTLFGLAEALEDSAARATTARR